MEVRSKEETTSMQLGIEEEVEEKEKDLLSDEEGMKLDKPDDDEDEDEEEDEEDEDGPLKCSPCRVRQEREEMQTAWSVSAPGFTSIGVRLKITGVRGVGGGAAWVAVVASSAARC